VIFGLTHLVSYPFRVKALARWDAKVFVVCDKFLAHTNFDRIIKSLNEQGDI